MALPPLWKVRRELNRIRVKIVLFTSQHLYDPVRKPIHDLTSRWRQQITPGRLSLTDRVAVFVIYQPKGLPGSILLTLDHLRQNEYSVVVVSNGPLRPEDRDTLAARASVVMERPNVGYDFGAYRDGIRHLWSLRHDMSRLVLMNDSTWFPLRRDDDSLARMEALGADLAGHIFKTENETKPQNDHIESHLLMFSRDFLNSSEFKRFWSQYRMSDHRTTTIEIGEKGITQLALCLGRRVKSLINSHWMLSTLSDLDDVELQAVLERTLDLPRLRHRDASFARRSAVAGQPWRMEFLEWADNSLRNSGWHLISATFVMPAMVYGKMGFAKKAADIRFHLARQEILDLESNGLIAPLDEVVRNEIALAVRSWTPMRGQEHIHSRRTALAIEVTD